MKIDTTMKHWLWTTVRITTEDIQEEKYVGTAFMFAKIIFN